MQRGHSQSDWTHPPAAHGLVAVVEAALAGAWAWAAGMATRMAGAARAPAQEWRLCAVLLCCVLARRFMPYGSK